MPRGEGAQPAPPGFTMRPPGAERRTMRAGSMLLSGVATSTVTDGRAGQQSSIRCKR